MDWDWCENELTVSAGTDQEIDDFLASIAGDCAIDFDKIIPQPHEVRRDYDVVKANSWRLANWGTIWNAADDACVTERGRLINGWRSATLKFHTRKTPPIQIVEKLAKHFNRITFMHQFDCPFGSVQRIFNIG